MLALQGDLEDHGGAIAFNTAVTRIARTAEGWAAFLDGADPEPIVVDAVVNSAGLTAQALARATEGYPPERVPRQVLARGNYFACLGRPAFTRLIYPAPVEGGLGTHLTLDLAGRMRFGPDVEWIESERYEVDPRRAEKLSGPGEPQADFAIDGPAEHGLPGLVHLFGIESPGLTAALSLAEDVAERLG
jgi:L-2-hydroxyglutarate oxidase LhgO